LDREAAKIAKWFKGIHSPLRGFAIHNIPFGARTVRSQERAAQRDCEQKLRSFKMISRVFERRAMFAKVVALPDALKRSAFVMVKRVAPLEVPGTLTMHHNASFLAKIAR